MMNIWSKLLTALRGGANEVGEALVDGQALRILEQEIRDADTQLHKSKEALAQIMARHMLASEREKNSTAKIEELEHYALKALASGDETLATEVAEKIAALETLMPETQAQTASFGTSAAQLRKAITLAQDRIHALKQQMDSVKTTESVQAAQLAVSQSCGAPQASLQVAAQSLDRLKLKQAELGAKIEATAQLDVLSNPDAALENKLIAAGIVPSKPSASSVLTRLRARTHPEA